MHLSHFLPLAILPFSLAKDIHIDVGKGGLIFDPDSVTAAVGDKLNFFFYPQNHSVAQSKFASPCQPEAGGIYSGFFPEASGVGSTIFSVTVNTTSPLWLYCSQAKHCESGMAMVVNAPSSNNTLAAYQAAAKIATTASPSAIAGGVIITSASANVSNTTAASSNSTSSSGSSSGSSNGSSSSPSSPSSTTTSTTPAITQAKSSLAGQTEMVGMWALICLGMVGWLVVG